MSLAVCTVITVSDLLAPLTCLKMTFRRADRLVR